MLSLPDTDLSGDPQVLSWPVQGQLLPEPSALLFLLAGLGLMPRLRRTTALRRSSPMRS